MSIDDRTSSDEPVVQDGELPVVDLSQPVDARTAEKVRGGADASAPKVSEITISKPVDISSTKLF
jgi:hypothetical protein